MKIELVKKSDDSGQECYKNDKNDSKKKNLVIIFDDKMHTLLFSSSNNFHPDC